MMANKLHVSVGNTKIGRTANVSLLPVVTCPQGVACAKECYARLLMYSKTAEKAWLDNTAYAVNDPRGFIRSVWEWVDSHKVEYFRWHVGGDVPSYAYYEGMCDIARFFGYVEFLVFTKRREYIWPRLGNLHVIWSAWVGEVVPTLEQRRSSGIERVAWVEGDGRAPKSAIGCRGTCERCRECWGGGSEDLLLKKH